MVVISRTARAEAVVKKDCPQNFPKVGVMKIPDLSGYKSSPKFQGSMRRKKSNKKYSMNYRSEKTLIDAAISTVTADCRGL